MNQLMVSYYRRLLLLATPVEQMFSTPIEFGYSNQTPLILRKSSSSSNLRASYTTFTQAQNSKAMI